MVSNPDIESLDGSVGCKFSLKRPGNQTIIGRGHAVVLAVSGLEFELLE